MDSTILGLVLDSSAVIAAERKKQPIPDFIESVFRANGAMDLALSPVTVAELVHGIYRAKTPDVSQRRRQYIGELWNWFQSTPLPIGQGGL